MVLFEDAAMRSFRDIILSLIYICTWYALMTSNRSIKRCLEISTVAIPVVLYRWVYDPIRYTLGFIPPARKKIYVNLDTLF
jgi:hypothetical protein